MRAARWVGTRFPRMAALLLCIRMPRRPQRWRSASSSSWPVWRDRAAASFLNSTSATGCQPPGTLPQSAGRQCPASCSPPLPHLSFFISIGESITRGSDFLCHCSPLEEVHHRHVQSRVLPPCPIWDEDIGRTAILAWEEKSTFLGQPKPCCYCRLENGVPQVVVAAHPLSTCPTIHVWLLRFQLKSHFPL